MSAVAGKALPGAWLTVALLWPVALLNQLSRSIALITEAS
jgi:hypothetical protein